MRTVEDRLHALSTAAVPGPPRPALDDLRGRVRARRRRRASTAAGALAASVAVVVVAWSSVAGTDAAHDVVAGPTADGSTRDRRDPSGAGGAGEAGDRVIAGLDDPVDLAHEALQRYGNDEPPAAVRVGSVDAASFRAWQREHTGGYGSANDQRGDGMLTVLLVRTSGGRLWAPHPRVGSSGQLSGDTVYVVFAEGLSPEGVGSTGTATWSEITATPWAQNLQQIDVG